VTLIQGSTVIASSACGSSAPYRPRTQAALWNQKRLLRKFSSQEKTEIADLTSRCKLTMFVSVDWSRRPSEAHRYDTRDAERSWRPVAADRRTMTGARRCKLAWKHAYWKHALSLCFQLTTDIINRRSGRRAVADACYVTALMLGKVNMSWHCAEERIVSCSSHLDSFFIIREF